MFRFSRGSKPPHLLLSDHFHLLGHTRSIYTQSAECYRYKPRKRVMISKNQLTSYMPSAKSKNYSWQNHKKKYSVSYGRSGRQFLSVSNTNFGLSKQVGICKAYYIHMYIGFSFLISPWKGSQVRNQFWG